MIDLSYMAFPYSNFIVVVNVRDIETPVQMYTIHFTENNRNLTKSDKSKTQIKGKVLIADILVLIVANVSEKINCKQCSI